MSICLYYPTIKETFKNKYMKQIPLILLAVLATTIIVSLSKNASKNDLEKEIVNLKVENAMFDDSLKLYYLRIRYLDLDKRLYVPYEKCGETNKHYIDTVTYDWNADTVIIKHDINIKKIN